MLNPPAPQKDRPPKGAAPIQAIRTAAGSRRHWAIPSLRRVGSPGHSPLSGAWGDPTALSSPACSSPDLRSQGPAASTTPLIRGQARCSRGRQGSPYGATRKSRQRRAHVEISLSIRPKERVNLATSASASGYPANAEGVSEHRSLRLATSPLAADPRQDQEALVRQEGSSTGLTVPFGGYSKETFEAGCASRCWPVAPARPSTPVYSTCSFSRYAPRQHKPLRPPTTGSLARSHEGVSRIQCPSCCHTSPEKNVACQGSLLIAGST